MNVVVAGLSPREEAAFGFFLGRSMKGWSWQGTAAGRGAVMPEADLFVADLVALGLGQWSETVEADLLRTLRGTPAVLIVASTDRSWSALEAGTLEKHALVLLAKPYGTEGMRLALEKAAEAVHRAPPAPAVAPTRPLPPSRLPPPMMAPPGTVMPGIVRPVVSLAVSAPAPARPAGGLADEVPGLTVSALHARLATLPDMERHVFLRRLSEMLDSGRPFEARFTVQNSVIFHPLDGWVASNTPMMVIERVCQSDAMASAVTMRDMEGAQAEERAQRLGMPMLELETFLWKLAAAALDKKRPP